MSFDIKVSFIIIVIQYTVILLFIYSNYVFIINMLLELFTISLFILFLISRFGYKLLIL